MSTQSEQATVTNTKPVHGVLPRPFLKWVGGKTWLLPKLQELRPKDFANYHEPFLGGGSHFFDLHSSGTSFLYDLNGELIRTYSAVQQSPELVIAGLNIHTACHSESYFYQLRDMDYAEMPDPDVAARMIYLNRACINGLYRVNRQGRLNTAWGQRDEVSFDCDNLFRTSSALHSAVISQGDFGNVLNNAKAGDFVFADPPYPNVFTKYTSVGFDNSDHRRLHSICDELDRRNVLFIQTNADCPFIRDLYRDFHIISVRARRNISCDENGRGTVGEVIIMNY